VTLLRIVLRREIQIADGVITKTSQNKKILGKFLKFKHFILDHIKSI